jgi:PAS domain S-box-containing protein
LGIISSAPDGIVTSFNPAAERLLGYTAVEVVGEETPQLWHDPEEVAQRARQLSEELGETIAPGFEVFVARARRGLPDENEWTFIRKDGTRVPVLLSVSALRDERGQITGFVGLVNDLTERKQAEEALREKTEELDRYFTTALDLLCIADTDGYFRRLNPQWESTLGFSVSELEGRRFLDYVHPGDMKATLQALSRLAEQKEVLNFINRYRCKSGAYRWIEWRSYPSGTRIYAVARDITERKRADEEIQRLKNYLADIIDSMPSMLVGIDRDKAVTQWNRQAEEITGISSTEAIGRPITDLLPDFSPWIKSMRGEIDLQRPTSMEKLLIEKDGERRFYDLMLYPIITNGVEGAVLRIEDVTEQARVQELMIQTEKMLSVGGMAAGMAHEINNPLGIIIQAAQNVERRVSPELPANRKAAEELGVDLEGINAYFEKRQIPEFIGSIREASLRASRIIANMLQFSRCAGTTMQPASPAGIIEQALELAAGDYDLKKKFDFRSIEIIRDYAPDMPEVPMVEVEIEQVMLNLLKNAAQAMIVNPEDRRPRITLRLRREERYALIEVEDNGPGMGEEVRRRAFEPFFTTKEPGMGTGLGLAVSYMIVTQNHKGLMEVESKPGKGACFRVRLPLNK